MINRLFSFLLLTYCFSFSMMYGVSSSDYEERFDPEKEESPFCAGFQYFEIKGYYDFIGKSKIKTCEFDDERLGFNEGAIHLSYTRFLSSCDALFIGIGDSHTHLNWGENPFFKERNFNNVIFSIGGFTTRYCDWLWKGGFDLAIDSEHFELSDYARYTLTLWGRYSWCNFFCHDFGLNIGFIGQAGLEKEWIVPIIGVDFKFNECWKLNLIYPVDLSLVYSFNDNWSFALTNRIINSRHRVEKNECVPKGIFEYRNSGIELGVNYNYCSFASANIHVGTTLGRGDLKINDCEGDVIRHVKFRSAGYIGGSFDVKF